MNLQDIKKMLQDELRPIIENLELVKNKAERIDTIERRVEDLLVDKAKNRLDIMSTNAVAGNMNRNIDVMKMDLEKVQKETNGLQAKLKTLDNRSKETLLIIKDALELAATEKELRKLEKRVEILEQN